MARVSAQEFEMFQHAITAVIDPWVTAAAGTNRLDFKLIKGGKEIDMKFDKNTTRMLRDIERPYIEAKDMLWVPNKVKKVG